MCANLQWLDSIEDILCWVNLCSFHFQFHEQAPTQEFRKPRAFNGPLEIGLAVGKVCRKPFIFSINSDVFPIKLPTNPWKHMDKYFSDFIAKIIHKYLCHAAALLPQEKTCSRAASVCSAMRTMFCRARCLRRSFWKPGGSADSDWTTPAVTRLHWFLDSL